MATPRPTISPQIAAALAGLASAPAVHAKPSPPDAEIRLGPTVGSAETLIISGCDLPRDFDTEFGLFGPDGQLIAADDDGCGGVGVPSRLQTFGLPLGTYYLAVGSFDLRFGPGPFEVAFVEDPFFSVFGPYEIDIAGATVQGEILPPRGFQWVSFEVFDSCLIADLTGDRANDLDDILAFVAAFDPARPSALADFNGDGANDLDDLLLFVSSFTAGPCIAEEPLTDPEP